MTQERLADTVNVHAKTVGRWLADPALVPHPRHRHAVARVLGVDETVLWPDNVRQIIKTGADREIVTAYPYRSMCPRSLWASLIKEADHDIWFAGYTNYFLWLEHPHLREILTRKARNGCRVRWLVGHPDSDVTQIREEAENVTLSVRTRISITLEHLEYLRSVDGIEARYSNDHVALSVFRFDDDMIVTPHLAYLVGHDSPAFHIHRRQNDGLFDRFAAHVETLWDGGRDAWNG
jgi:hypothetical protein